MTSTVYDALADIQSKIAVPKDRKNEFGGYSYRKAEDIIRAARAAAPQGAIITTSDRIEEIGGQIFVVSTASLIFAGEKITADSGAMHALTKKGMDAAQITGSACSYARKYALQGLFALDDGEHDPDARDNRQENGNDAAQIAIDSLGKADSIDAANEIWKGLPKSVRDDKRVIEAAKAAKYRNTQNKDQAA